MGAALLPMSLYELSSLSADAATIAMAWLLTALLLSPPRRTWLAALAGFASGLCKPAYFAYRFLNQLGDTELSCMDENTWACRDAHGGVQVLLWDYHHPKQDQPNHPRRQRHPFAGRLLRTNPVNKVELTRHVPRTCFLCQFPCPSRFLSRFPFRFPFPCLSPYPSPCQSRCPSPSRR